MTEKFYNIKYKTDVLHENLSADDAADKLKDYVDRFFSTENDEHAWPFNPNDLKLEEIIENG